MASVFVGTGYNQVVSFTTGDRGKARTVYGTLARAAVRSISIDPAEDRLLYATAKTIVAAYGSGDLQQLASFKGEQSIIKSEYVHPQAVLSYCLSDGSIHALPAPSLHQHPHSDSLHSETHFTGQKHNNFTCAVPDADHARYLFCGPGVVPVVVNLQTGALDWFGKNVKNDELDLQVPMRDVDAAFTDSHAIAVLHSDRKLRLYDVRGTHRRPVQDVALPLTQKSQMTRMRLSGEHEYFFSNDIGEVFRCDDRKEWKPTGKFKGITATVTDFQLTRHALFAASLDSHVHMFDLHSTKPIRKFYINKPVHCLRVEEAEEEVEVEGEEEVDLAEEEAEGERKVEKLKQIRKRNKVGLKYLQPREFDEPTEVKVEEARRKEWYEDLNPVDRREFEQ